MGKQLDPREPETYQLNPWAYIAGIVGADAHLDLEESTIYVASKDKKFLEEIVVPMIIKIARKPSVYWDKGASVYKAKMYSRAAWVKLFGEFGLVAGAKSQRLKPPINLSDEDVKWFIRGWFDGEGCIEKSRIRRRNAQYVYPRVGLKIKNEQLRDWIALHLKRLGVNCTCYKRSDQTFGIHINGRSPCRSFMRTIGFLDSVKNERLARVIEVCRGRVNPDSIGLR